MSAAPISEEVYDWKSHSQLVIPTMDPTHGRA